MLGRALLLLLFRQVGARRCDRQPGERATLERGGDAMKYRNTSLRARRKAVTLIELLVAIAATLVLMTAVTTAISMLGGRMGNNRATIEMIDQLRSVRQKLQSDLAGHTAQALPWQDAETGGGYIEIIEGNDPQMQDRLSGWPSGDNRFGDRDDIIALTVRSQGPPFVSTDAASAGGNDDESYVAEVIWYLKPDQSAPSIGRPLFKLYRHVELVLPNAGVGGAATTDGRLAELTLRENRWGTLNGKRSETMPSELISRNLPTRREDVVLTNVLSFDVKVWDPQAPIYADSANEKRVRSPGDPGYPTSPGGTVIDRGAYVDLGYFRELNTSTTPTSHFSSFPSQSGASVWSSPTWDTWPRFYERDGKDQNGNGKIDEGYDGIDNGGLQGVVDDPGELETRPPYSHPLRGIRITIRIYEPASQQVRQISVVQHFMPE